MKTLEKVFLSLALCLTIFSFVIISTQKPQTVFGSVDLGSDYQSTTTRTAITGIAYSTTTAVTASSVNGGFSTAVTGTLGSVVITGKNTGIINIYDATSTITNTQIGTTTLATFPTNAPEGTYTFDSRFRYGLVIEIVGTAPTSTVTYRAQ